MMTMLTPSTINRQALVAWIPAYIATVAHGFFLSPADVFLSRFLGYPLLCALALGFCAHAQVPEEEHDLEELGMPGTPGVNLAFSLWVLLPLGVVATAMLYAQLNGSYDSVSWVVIVFGGLIGNEVGRYLRFQRRD